MPARIPALALWFVALGVLAFARIGARIARVGWSGSAMDWLWIVGGALLLVLGVGLALRARRAPSRLRR